jgi:hypothetical protein
VSVAELAAELRRIVAGLPTPLVQQANVNLDEAQVLLADTAARSTPAA